MKRNFKRLAIHFLLIAAFIMIITVWAIGKLELYFYPWPEIDTKFGDGYSEENFNQIKIGMLKSQVISKLGAPIEIVTAADGKISLWYSQDGNCSWGDFAWLGRTVIVQDDKVIDITKQVFYD